MPVNKDPSGRRWVQAEVEVPGSPEQVWQAIATGPGISAWFVPTEVEEREGGGVTASFGPGMDSHATITTWEPPHRFVADSRDDMGPGDPAVATEWIVEARSGGVCIVRVVHSWYTDSDQWDDQYEQAQYGWLGFFLILRLYLAHFAGQPCAAFQLGGWAPAPKDAAWAALTRALGFVGARVGQRVETAQDAPPLAGLVEEVGPPENPEVLLLRLDVPTSGLAHLFAMPMAGQAYLSMRCFLYGGEAAAAVARDEPRWQAWMSERFPMGGGQGDAG